MRSIGNINDPGTLGIPAQNNGFRLLVSPREAAKLLSICERTLYTLTKAGEIPAVRRGRLVRYSPDDLRAWIESAKNIKISP